MKSTRIAKLKVCGITRLSDAQAALDAGADWLGVIAVPNTPRYLDAANAKTLVEELRESHPQAYVVGVFQGATPAKVEAYAKTVKLNAIQLHGQENPADYAYIGLPIIKVLHLYPHIKMADLQTQAARYLEQPQVQTCLLDLPKGSGLKSILEWPDFARLNELTGDIPCMVAGGLTPENIETVLEALSPWGVDVASGVESAPGEKDLQRLTDFCQAIKGTTSLENPDIPSIGEERPCNP